MKQTKTTAKAASRFSLRADRVAPRRRAVVAAARRIVEHLETRTLLSAATANTDTPLPEPYLPPQHDLLDLTGGYLSAPSSGAPLTIARNYLASHAASLGVSAADLGSSVVSDQYTDADTGTTHIYLTQTFDGLPVANANLVVNVTAHGQVLNVAGGFVNGLAAAQGSGTQNGPVQLVTSASTPTISAVQALQDATADLGLSLSAQPTLVQSSSPVDMGYGADETGTLTAPGVSSSDVPAGLQYIWTPDGVRLSWDLQIQTTDQAHWYDVSVGATAVGSTGAGDLVFANDWVDHANYNVMALPNESANEGTRSVLTDPNDPTMSPYGWHDTNGVTGPEYTITRGNNVFAYTDTANANVPGFSPDGGASLNFDYPWDTTQSPSTTSNQSAAVTNLFYLNNTLHDIHARYGFTEAAGNFQVMNYSGQGVGNDPVLAEAQDGGGTNNANFATPVDGSSPRMQMYLWTYSTPSRDGDFDNGIVVHEYGHGVSNRLTGGPANSNALSALQSGGMGEGWSDWWALMLTQRPTDLQNSAYPMGTWALNQAATGAGIRRYPYSYNTSIDPETFGLYGGANGTEVHNTGELWSTALWDMNWLLIQKYGFGTNVAGGYDPNTTGKNGGNNLALKLVMDGLKLQPANPSFVDARNAIIAADQALNGGQDLFQIWSAFARRGLGYSAVDSSSSATTITTATDLPVGLLNPRVTAQSPTGAQTTPLSSIDFTFSKAMDPTSFSVAADVASFTGPGAVDLKSAITGFSWINSNTTLHVTFSAQSTNGVYKMVIGPQILAGDNASPMDQDGDGTAGEPTQDQYTATFGFESQFLQVASTTPANGSLVSLPFTTLDVKFNEPYDPATLGASDLTLSQGTVTNAAVVDSTTARFTLSGITNEGTLTVAIAAGALSDTDGFGMLAYSGSFATDIGTRAMPATTTLAPRGSMVYQSATSGIIGTTADTDSFTMSLDPGQTLSLVLHPTTAQLRPSMQLYSPANVLLGTITAAAANQDAVIQSAPVAAAGTYTIVVASDGATSGSYALTAMLNAAVEAEEHNGPSNDTIATAENMDSAFRVMAPGGPTIGSVVGNLATSATDFYAVSLTAGQTVSFAVAMQSGTGTPALSLSNAAGTSLASGVSTITNVQSGIANYVVPTTAVYYLKVTGSNVAYTLLATENAAFDFESNGTIATAQPVGGSRAVAGAVGSGIVGNVKVGLIQDQLPWGSSSDTTVATGLGYSVTVISSASLATANLSAYDMIVLSGQQTSATYNTVQTNLSRIRSFVVAGGVYIANYAAYSTDNAYSYSVLPDAASGTFTYLGGSDINVLAPSSPLVNGPGGTITDTTLDGGNYSFHGYTTVVPSGATTVLSGPSASQIVAFDYPDGAGHVIVDTIPIEFYGGTGNFGIFHKNLFAYGGSFKPTNDDDYYAVTLAAGQTVQLGTSTPGDGAGEPGNTLDPAIAIYDAGGNTLGADDNGGADGRNAHLSYTAATAGTYYVRVYPSPNSTTSGEYVLNLFDKALTTTLPVSAQETAGAINGTLSVATAPTSDLVVTLTSSDSARVSVPSTLMIPAGQTSVPLPITVLDNSLLDGLEQVTIAAVAGGYSSGNSVITIHDDETATLSVTLPSTAREGDGVIVGTVTASAAPTRDIVVALSSDTLSKLSVPASVVIKAGQLSATFNATVIDNTVIDGALNATVTAAVDNWTSGSSTIAVADNDGFITVTMPTSGWEGQTFTGTVTIGGTLGSSLIVNLASNDTTELTVPSTVTIAAGKTSASFTLTLPTDALKDGSQTAMLTASATGLTDGSGNIVVHDGNLDHITFDVITGPKTAGTAFSATARAFNIANEAIVTYATTGTLTAAGQAGSEPVTPSGAAFTAGVWTGSITLTVADAAVALTMTSGGIAGASSSFAVQAGAVAGFTWGAVSTPQIANVPFGQTITAKDANGNTVTSYNGTVTLSGLAGTTTSQTIMGNSSSTSSSSGLLYTMGFAFTPTATAQITAVRSISGTKVSIWNDTGTLLVSQAVSGTVGTWTETQLTTPITLSANTRYRIAAYMNGQTYYYRSDTPTFSWGAINFSCYSSGDTFPTTTSTGEYLVDLRANVGTFTNVPITPTSATFTSGVWTGNINVSQSATGMHLHVVDAASHIGDSGNFDVIQRTLTLSLPSDVREDDGTVNGLLSVSPTPNADLVISLASSDPSRLSVPATITIPAGQTSVPLPLTILDDNLLNGLEGITITATLATYASTPAVVNVHDNETAVLSVSVPASAKEGDGIVVGTVTASAAPTSDVVIQLSSGKPGRASVPATVVLKAGQTTASFNISIIDNTVIDGTQFVSIGAAADNWTSGFKSISVQDNDNTITLTLPASGWEGQTFSGSVAMGGTLSTDLVVNLSSLDTTELTLPATVTIPAGQKTATFTITLPTDGIKDGTQTAGVTAAAQGLIAGNGSVLVHDVDLDHLGFDTITGPKSAGVAFVVTARAMNIANESIVTYTGAGTLGAFGQAGGSLTLTPTSLTFTAGVWTGNATIVAVDPAATLKATVGSLSATSNSFVMQAGPVASFTWNTIGSTQTVNQPFGVTVTAKDANGFVATGYNGTSTLSGQIGTTSSQTLLNGLTYTSSSSGTFTLGYAFTPNTLATVTAVRSMFGTKVSIWTDTGTLLASQTVSGAAGQWTETALTTPITLQAGTRYRISEYTGGGSYFWRNDLPTMPWATDGGGYFFAGDGFPSSTSSGFYMVDLRADVGSFTSIPVTPTSATFSNGVWTGNVTVTQPGNSVHLHIDDGLAHIGDSGVFNVNPTVSPIPQTPDLLAVTDSGSSTTDNITNFNNAAVAKALQFSVGGTTSGATVTIYADGVAIGSTVASGATTTVTTNGTTKLTDGVRSITARQTLSGLPESLDSTALSITVDTVAPTAPVAPVLQAASDSGVSNSDGVTNQNKPTFNVAAGEAGVLHLSVAGTTSFSASTTVAGAGTYPLLLSGAGTIPGGYSTTLAYSGVPAPRQVLIGDINGDGKQDVVVLSAGGVITPMLYLGGGAFQALAPFTVAAGATADGLLVDVDKDNKLDLVVAAGNGAAVFRGKGDGSFLAETTLGTLGAASNTIGVADFNGDGKPDIVVGTNGGAGAIPLARYFGNGDGTFGAPAAMPTTSITITAVYVLGTGDFDKDGKQDVAVICAQTSTPNYPYEWTPLLGDGAGGARTTMGSLYTQKPTAMAIADYNNDGWLDFAIAQPLRIDIDFAYTATSPMQWISGVYVATTNTPDHLSAMDVDGDGQNDIVATQGGAMFYGLSKCAPNYYEFGAAQTMSVSQSASGVVSGLFTGTKRDILAVNPATNSLLMLPGNTFTALAALPDGTYQATAWAEDLAGNASPISTASPITIDTAGPTVQLTAISPNPRSTPVDADTLQFNEAIAGLTKGSFTLTLSGGANLLDGSQTIVGPDKINWTIGNLTGLTGAGGDYILSLTKAGITDLAGNPLSAGASVQWTCNPPATQTLSIDGTSGDDTIYLNMDAAGQNLQVWINASTSGAPTATYPVSGFNAVVVNAGDGNDTVTLDLTNGAIAAANGITVNGGNGTGDSLIVQLPDSGGAATVGASSINITTPAADGVGYAAVESLTITGGAGNDTVTQAAQPIASFWFNGGGNGNDTLNVSAGTYSCAVAQQLAALNITAPGKVLVQPSDAGALNFGAIALSGSGPLLDLANNTALLKAALSDIEAYIQNGCIMTSSAGLSVGVADIGSGKIKVMGTYSGDGNLDGTVNVGDLGLLATHYGTSTANHWSTGDFDGNGVVDVADLGALATHYGQTVPTAGGGGAAALAQPASLISTSAQDPFGKKTITDQSLVDAVEALID